MSTAPEITPGIYFELTLRPDVSVGYFTEISGLSAEVEVMTYNEGGNNSFVHRFPTRMKFPNLVLKRGISNEDALEKWFAKSYFEATLTEISITMLNEVGTRLRTWSFVNAYPIKWTGPQFNVGQSAVATEAIEIVHEGIKVV